MTAIALHTPDCSVSEMTKEELVRHFAEAFGITVASLVRAAAIVEEYHRRDYDLSDLEGVAAGMVHRLRDIANGRLLPELVYKFFNRPGMLNTLARLQLDDQKKFVDDEPLKLLTFTQDGRQTHLMVKPSKLMKEPDQVKQIVASDHLRDEAEQALWLDTRRKNAMKPKTEKIGTLTLDHERGGVTHRREFIPLATLVSATRSLQGKK